MMESISTVKQSVYLNGDTSSPKKPVAGGQGASDDNGSQAHEHTKQTIKIGSKQAMADAEAIFARANSYADVSAKAQKSLQAYEAVEVSLKREAVSQLMGVDIYA